MSSLKKFNPNNFFTKEEISILLFLLSFTILGITIKIYKKFDKIPDGKIQFEKIDLDSILVAVFNDKNFENPEKTNSEERKEPLEKKSIDINKASAKELTRLPGIGEKTALKIIEYRKKYGGFNRLEDLMKVERIGPKLFEKIKEYLIITK